MGSAGISWDFLDFAPNCGLGLDILHKFPHSRNNCYFKHVLLTVDGGDER